jgi:iron complex outermembrane recepter protein
VRYVGKTFGDNFNTLVVPSYTVFDATVSYDLAYARPERRVLFHRLAVL